MFYPKLEAAGDAMYDGLCNIKSPIERKLWEGFRDEVLKTATWFDLAAVVAAADAKVKLERLDAEDREREAERRGRSPRRRIVALLGTD